MFNMHSIIRDSQRKSYNSSLMQKSIFSTNHDDSGHGDMLPIYEQIKNEVVSSVLNWLSMYLAADQEDKKCSDESNDVKHCCECSVKRRSEGSIHSAKSYPYSPDYEHAKQNQGEFEKRNDSGSIHSAKSYPYSPEYDHAKQNQSEFEKRNVSGTVHSAKSYPYSPDYDQVKRNQAEFERRNDMGSVHSSWSAPFSPQKDQENTQNNFFEKDLDTNDFNSEVPMHDSADLMPRDSNMFLTEYRAYQVWPEWCQHIDRRSDNLNKGAAAYSHVYYDKVNSRLCVYRRGLVQYPSIVQQPGDVDKSSPKQSLKTISETKESLIKEVSSKNVPEPFGNAIFIDPHKHFADLDFNKGFGDCGSDRNDNVDDSRRLNDDLSKEIPADRSVPNVQIDV